MKRATHILIGNLVITIAVLLAANVVIGITDPVGAVAYADNLLWINNHAVQTEAGHTYPEGWHQTHMGPITIDEQGNRLVSVSATAQCTIAILGDSIAFGLGVGDADVFVHHIADQYQNVRWVNTAKPGYNHRVVVAAAGHTDADGYIYLVTNNDHYGEVEFAPRQAYQPLAVYIAWYYQMWINRKAQSASRNQELVDSMIESFRQLDREKKVVFYGYHEEKNINAARAVDGLVVELIPHYTQIISQADSHPNGAGHQQIAEAMMGTLDRHISNICN